MRGEAVWATGTNGRAWTVPEVQKDGNFVLYAGDKPLWHSDTKGKKDVKLVIQDDRNVVLYAADGAAWSSRTETDAPAARRGRRGRGRSGGQRGSGSSRAPTVVAGDTLFNIAKQYLGDGNRYMELAAANNIPNPDHRGRPGHYHPPDPKFGRIAGGADSR